MSQKTGLRSAVWVATAALLVAGVTFALGMWQLGRASTKEALLAQRGMREQQPAQALPDLLKSNGVTDVDSLLDRRVYFEGEWLNDATVFLDNRPMNGRSGFIVVTPLRMLGSDGWVLVQRGWVPRRFDNRHALPDLPGGTGVVRVEGRLAPPPSKLYELGPEAGGRIRQNVDIVELSRTLGQPAVPLSVLQSSSASGADALTRDWPVVGGDAHKHLGYAFQWFGLSLLTVVLYVWFQIIVPRRRRV